MENRLERKLEEAASEFRRKVIHEVKSGKRKIPEPGGFKEVEIKSGDKLANSLNTVYPDRNIVGFKKIVTQHYDLMKSYFSYSVL